MSRAVERVRRLLAMVPYVIEHPGVQVAELARIFGGTEKAIIADLNLLFLTGVPPYTPADLIEVQIDEDGVEISMADYFSRPLRLTRNEAIALYLRGKAVMGTPGLTEATALAAALAKIEAALGDELGAVSERVETAGTTEAPEALEPLRRATEGRERITIGYYSAARDEVGTRSVDPEQIFSALGLWYLVAWDVDLDAERTFRVDRVREVTSDGDHFEPRGLAGAGRPLYASSERDVEVELEVGPGARWVAEYYGGEIRSERTDGTIRFAMRVSQLAWVAKLVLRLADQARVQGPAELKDLVREEAQAALARYP